MASSWLLSSVNSNYCGSNFMAHHHEQVDKAPSKYAVKAEMVLWLQIHRVTCYSTIIKYRM
jgi:hypothetical protein